MTLWDKVEHALVGGIDDAFRTFVQEVATGLYAVSDIHETAKELQAAVEENDALRKQHGA